MPCLKAEPAPFANTGFLVIIVLADVAFAFPADEFAYGNPAYRTRL